MTCLPAEEEMKLLRRRHPELGQELVERIVGIAGAIRNAPELNAGLSVRATDEACVYLKHPLMAGEQKRMLLRSAQVELLQRLRRPLERSDHRRRRGVGAGAARTVGRRVVWMCSVE